MQNLEIARNALAGAGKLIKVSVIYASKAWGIEEQPDFLNQAVLLETDLNPYELLEVAFEAERKSGRIRELKWGPRLLDVDILYFKDDIISEEALKIPHPYLSQRRFTLVPLAEIAPCWIHPELRKTVSQLLEECPDTGEVWRFPGE